MVLDYDDTFTRDPKGWMGVAELLKMAGHEVIGCTMRYPSESGGIDARYLATCSHVYFSRRKAKRAYLASLNIFPHVWIDDTPEFIHFDARQ